MTRPASRHYCPSTNSHKHKWHISRVKEQVVEGTPYKYTFRQCTACEYDDLLIDKIRKGPGKHRRT